MLSRAFGEGERHIGDRALYASQVKSDGFSSKAVGQRLSSGRNRVEIGQMGSLRGVRLVVIASHLRKGKAFG